jgi:hypothetical protein
LEEQLLLLLLLQQLLRLLLLSFLILRIGCSFTDLVLLKLIPAIHDLLAQRCNTMSNADLM